jgi:membrane protease YdiL (CAAX protease family)
MLLAKGVKLVWPVAMSLPHICTVSSSDDMIRGNVSRIIQSGDLLAASMFCGTAVILGPICEELFFRWVAILPHRSTGCSQKVMCVAEIAVVYLFHCCWWCSCRGMVLQCLVDAYPRLTPVVLLVTSLWFAASHSYEIVGTAVVTTCGICHGWSYLAAGRNILVPIVAHGFFNLMQLIGMLVFP